MVHRVVSPSFPWLMMWLLALITGAASLYYAAIISGLYKDPLMARFRVYGEERRPYPACRFLEAFGIWCIVMGLLVRELTARTTLFQSSFASLSFFVLAFMTLGSSVVVRRKPFLRESLPRWYFTLLRDATRQERRFIGYAWLRIPRKMRWRLNGDQAAFHVWADMVRITVVYGARDPDDPWVLWG